MILFVVFALVGSVLVGWLGAAIVMNVLNQSSQAFDLATIANILFQTPQPTDLLAFQWVVIIALAGVIPVLYWQNIKVRDGYTEELKDIVKAYHEALHINTLSNKEVARSLEDSANIGRLENQIKHLEQQMEHRLDKRRE